MITTRSTAPDAMDQWLDGFAFLRSIQAPRARYRAHIVGRDVLPLTPLRCTADLVGLVGALEAKMRAALVGGLGYDQDQAASCVTAAVEVCQNAYRHAGPGEAPRGWVALRADRDGLRFMAFSLGPDIASRLGGKYCCADEAGAVRLACRAGVTSEDAGGLGLYQALAAVRAVGGVLCVDSGSVRARFGAAGDERVSAGRYLRGAQVGFYLPKKEVAHG